MFSNDLLALPDCLDVTAYRMQLGWDLQLLASFWWAKWLRYEVGKYHRTTQRGRLHSSLRTYLSYTRTKELPTVTYFRLSDSGREDVHTGAESTSP